LGQVEAAAAAGEVGNDQCRQHAQHRPTDAVEHLQAKKQRRIGDRREQQYADRQRPEPDKEKRAAPPAFRLASDPRSHQGNDDLRQDDQCRDHERGALRSLVNESLYNERQHGCIGELKQEQADREREQPGALPKGSPACSRGLTGHVVMRRAAGAAEMDVACANARESDEQRRGECDDCQEYRLIRQQISDQAHESGRDQASRRGEALVAPQPLRQRRMPH
jgi:hypothetical protein